MYYIIIYAFILWSLRFLIYSLVSVIKFGKFSVITTMNIFLPFFFHLIFVVYILCNNAASFGYLFDALHFLFSLHLSFGNCY